jgi:hypothetical protein
MGRTRIGIYARWEEETREASRRGAEALLPPAGEWPSFVDAVTEGQADAGAFDPAAASEALSKHLEKVVGAEAPPPPASGPKKTEAAPPQSPPDATLPTNLQTEIEDFLNRDKGGELSDEEMKAFLKGAIDPNVEPDK